MKLSAICLALLLLSAPAWAGDRILYPDKSFATENLPIIYSEKPKPARYEHKIVPESELLKWLNEGWELEKTYTVEDWTTGSTVYKNGRVNKAIIRRKAE